jgi:membrane protein implicated in regulation of membrane protease activity
MDILNNAPVIWFILGFILFVLEFMLPGLIVFFFGVGAWIVGILLLFFDLSLNSQLVIFLSSSVISILLFRKTLKRIMWSRKNSSEIEDEFIGKTGIAESFIGPGKNGKVAFKGTVWDARSMDTIEKGETVAIVGNESILLIVKSIKNIA